MSFGKEVKDQTVGFAARLVSLIIWAFISLLGIALFIDLLVFISRPR